MKARKVKVPDTRGWLKVISEVPLRQDSRPRLIKHRAKVSCWKGCFAARKIGFIHAAFDTHQMLVQAGSGRTKIRI